jgi:MoxR-like ATPase
MLNNKFRAIENELNQKYFERKEVIRGLLVALLSKQHILLLGAPGTSKSTLTEDLCQRISGKYFKKLVARTSTPEELFGPMSLKGLENDEYRRVTTNRLPEAEISFIDEIFKCNSAVLNNLLGILNEREFENGGMVSKVPLQFMAGASNELPENREELGALWDRFLLRYVVKYIRDPRNFEALLLGTNAPQTVTTLTRDEVTQAQAEVAKVDISGIINQIFMIRDKMLEMKIDVSDRRWKQSLGLISANAWIEGRNAATEEDLEILIYALWQEPDQIAGVQSEIMNLCNPFDREALDLLDQAQEVYQNAMSAQDDKATQAGTEGNSKLKMIGKRLEELQKQAASAGKTPTRIAETLEKVKGYNKEVVNKCLGI